MTIGNGNREWNEFVRSFESAQFLLINKKWKYSVYDENIICIVLQLFFLQGIWESIPAPKPAQHQQKFLFIQVAVECEELNIFRSFPKSYKFVVLSTFQIYFTLLAFFLSLQQSKGYKRSRVGEFIGCQLFFVCYARKTDRCALHNQRQNITKIPSGIQDFYNDDGNHDRVAISFVDESNRWSKITFILVFMRLFEIFEDFETYLIFL